MLLLKPRQYIWKGIPLMPPLTPPSHHTHTQWKNTGLLWSVMHRKPKKIWIFAQPRNYYSIKSNYLGNLGLRWVVILNLTTINSVNIFHILCGISPLLLTFSFGFDLPETRLLRVDATFCPALIFLCLCSTSSGPRPDISGELLCLSLSCEMLLLCALANASVN